MTVHGCSLSQQVPCVVVGNTHTRCGLLGFNSCGNHEITSKRNKKETYKQPYF